MKMAEKPADKDHPFGHGRIEYIAALVVSFLVLEVGFTFLKDSIGRIRTPESLNFQAVSVAVLILSVAVKLWLGTLQPEAGGEDRFESDDGSLYRLYGGCDHYICDDPVAHFLRGDWINIDGFVGVGVALVVMWAGVALPGIRWSR